MRLLTENCTPFSTCVHDRGYLASRVARRSVFGAAGRAEDHSSAPMEPVAREAYGVRQARHDVPDVPTHIGRANLDQHFLVSDLRLDDVPELQDIGQAV